MQRAEGSNHSIPIPGPGSTGDHTTDNTQIQKYLRRTLAGLGKLSPEEQRRARDLFVPKESKRAHSKEGRRSDKHHPAAEAGQEVVFPRQQLQDTSIADTRVWHAQDSQPPIHGFFVDQNSAYPLLASVPINTHQQPLSSGTNQLDTREILCPGVSSGYQSTPSIVDSNGLMTGQSSTQPQPQPLAYARTPATSWAGTPFVQMPQEPPALYQQLNQYG